MLLGIISDTHDRLSMVRKACSLFKERNITTIVHAGDFISPFVIPLFEGFQMYGTFGNNDGEKKGLLTKFSAMKAIVTDIFCEVRINNVNIAITHGHIPSLLELLMRSNQYDLIVYGHTHEPEIRGSIPILINPGECCGYLSDRSTVVIFDTEKRKGEILDL